MTFVYLCFESMTMREWQDRKATGGCLAGKGLFISSEIHYSFLVISFHPSAGQFPLWVRWTRIIGLLTRFTHRIDGFCTTGVVHWLKQMFNSVCINCVSLFKAINFVFEYTLKQEYNKIEYTSNVEYTNYYSSNLNTGTSPLKCQLKKKKRKLGRKGKRVRKETNTRHWSYLASSCGPECRMTEELIPMCLQTAGRLE